MESVSIKCPQGPLTDLERADLARHMQTVERGMLNFVEVGVALLDICDRRLYRETHSTFEEFVKHHYKMSASRAYQLCRAAEVVKTMPEFVDHGPQINERQARELAKLPPENRAEVWQKAVETAPENGITAKHIKSIAAEVAPRSKPLTSIVINVDSEVSQGEYTEREVKPLPPRTNERIVGSTETEFEKELENLLPRRDKRKADSKWWYSKATPEKRGEFFWQLLCSGMPVKFKEKEKLKKQMEFWLDTFVNA